ncbi:MAG: hypothetical protein ABIA97_06105 [Candidatus Omnitrophota bacterium]
MRKSFLSSLRKIFRVFLIIVISILVLYLVIDLSLSLILNFHLNKTKTQFKHSANLALGYRIALFDIFYGVSIDGLFIAKDKNKILEVSNIRLKLDMLSTIFKRQLLCKEIHVNDPHIYAADKLDKNYLSFLLTTVKNSQEMFRSSMIKLNNFNLMEAVNFDLGGYIALAQNKILLTRGKIQILKSKLLGKTDIDQSNGLLDMPLDYALEATYLDSDFVINKLDLLGFTARLNMSGRVKDYANTFDLDIRGELKNLLIEDIKQFNNDYLYSRGILESKFSFGGPLEKVNFLTSIKIKDCSMNILDALKIDKVDIDLIWDNQSLRSKNISGLIHGTSPINLSLEIANDQNLDRLINLEASVQNLDLFDYIKVIFDGSLSNQTIGGDIEVTLRKAYVQKTLIKEFLIKKFSLNLVDWDFGSDVLEIILEELKPDQTEISSEQFEIIGLNGDLVFDQDNFKLSNFRTNMLGGTLKGSVILGSKDNAFYYDSQIYLSNFNATDLLKDLSITDYQLTGLLSGTLNFKSKLKEAVSGDLQIINGRLDNNAILNAISDFFGLPSLRTVDFSNLKVIFQKVWNQYNAKISLFSKDVSIYLDNKSFMDGTVDGYLLVKLSTELMDQSPRFKRLFKYIGYKEPTVYFPFQLKGYAGNPRIEWLQNEFKEKIQGFLSDSSKNLLQSELSKMIEGLAQ